MHASFIAFLLLAVNVCIAGERTVIIHLRGVYNSEIKLIPFDGLQYDFPVKERTGVKAGDTVKFIIPEKMLPGEFLFRFGYLTKSGEQPRPAGLNLMIYNEDIEVYANPQYLYGDSLFLVNDRENIIWKQFSEKDKVKRQQIVLLEQLLEGFTDSRSPVWRTAARQYKQLRGEYNRWLKDMEETYRDLYVGHLFAFQQIPDVNWTLPENERFEQLAEHWFYRVGFNDTLCLRSRQLNDFMNAYVNLFSAKITSEELRDSLLLRAGRLACEKASSGNPRVYGWLVDYFYREYESHNIPAGMQMLEKYTDDPFCITNKKKEIAWRIDGVRTLVPGTQAANLLLEDVGGRKKVVDLRTSVKDYQLVVFYDYDCSRCNELLGELRNWYRLPQNEVWFSIYTIALSGNREHWISDHRENAFPWTDLYAPGGFFSKAAAVYFVLSTPNMFIIDKKGKLVDLPVSVNDLNKFLNG